MEAPITLKDLHVQYIKKKKSKEIIADCAMHSGMMKIGCIRVSAQENFFFFIIYCLLLLLNNRFTSVMLLFVPVSSLKEDRQSGYVPF